LSKFKELWKSNIVKDVKRFLRKENHIVNYEAVADYLKSYLNKAPKTYNQQITSLRRFIRDFLGYKKLISSFKMTPVDEPQKYTDVTKTQVRKGFIAQQDSESKAVYLFTATTGLTKSEILSLLRENVDFEMRTVRSNHFTRKKRSGITSYNGETGKIAEKIPKREKG